MKTIDITWDRFHQDTLSLAEQLSPRLSTIVAVTRGGLVPAAILAKKLCITLVETICTVSYETTKRNEVKILKYTKIVDSSTSNLLVVDDVADSGETIKAIRELLPNAFYATVYAKQPGIQYVGAFTTEIPKDTWINFPWEPR